jgi:ubiquinone/menaquinone biosynthesis C-methylase UbiE
MTDSGATAKDRVRAQYGAVGDAYVKSAGHATGSDLQRMVEVANPQPDERMLDLATGGGHVARVFAPHVAEVVASDLTPEILTHAAASFAEQGLANITTALVDAEEIPYSDASFDLVTCRIAPHHFPHPDRFAQEAARVLRSGGRFVLIDSTVPESEPGALFNRFETLRDPSHVRSLTVAEWEALISSTGLVLDLAETFHKRHDFADWTGRSRMTEGDRATLERMMLDADPTIRDEHHAEIIDGRLVAFQDTKTLFLAHKP